MKDQEQRQRITPPEKEERLNQELAAKNLAVKIKKADKENRHFREKRCPEKSMLQILRKIRGELGAFNEAVAIARIKWRWCQLSPDKIAPEDRSFLAEEEKILLHHNQPPVEIALSN